MKLVVEKKTINTNTHNEYYLVIEDTNSDHIFEVKLSKINWDYYMLGDDYDHIKSLYNIN